MKGADREDDDTVETVETVNSGNGDTVERVTQVNLETIVTDRFSSNFLRLYGCTVVRFWGSGLSGQQDGAGASKGLPY